MEVFNLKQDYLNDVCNRSFETFWYQKVVLQMIKTNVLEWVWVCSKKENTKNVLCSSHFRSVVNARVSRHAKAGNSPVLNWSL